MNNNEYLVLNKISDWQRGLAYNLDLSAQGISVSQTDDYLLERTIEPGEMAEISTVSDFCPGKCDIIYLLHGQECKLAAYDLKNRRFIWIDDLQGLGARPGKIAFTPGTFFLLDQNRPQQLLSALAQINHQIRWLLGSSSPGSAGFKPVQLCTDENGFLWVLAEDPAGSEEKSIIKIHPGGFPVSRLPVDPKIDVQKAILSVKNGLLYLLDQVASRLIIYDSELKPVIIMLDFPPSGMCLDSRQNIYIGQGGQPLAGQEDQRFIHKFSADGKYLDFIRGYKGPADKLAMDGQDRMYIFDDTRQQISILSPGKRIVDTDNSGMPTGLFISAALDSTLPGTRWHKLALEADVPAGTQLLVSYLISDTKFFNGFENLDSLIIDDSLKGDSLKLRENIEALAGLDGWLNMAPNPEDALISGPSGRYLWLMVRLLAGQRQTPVLKEMRIYFPRVSYLEYLPAVYQEDEESRDFLERFLALFHTFNSRLEYEIDHIERHFDPGAVSSDFLPWLSSWLAISEDNNWDEEQLRKLLKRAPDLYRKRGTRTGIEEMIEIYTGSRPMVVENWQIRRMQTDGYKDVLVKLFGDDPYTFTVLIKPCQAKTSDQQLTVKRIVESEKPAHTRGDVVFLQPWIYLDQHTYLGINSYLNKPNLRLDVGSIMPRDTVLSDIREAGQLQRRSRLGLDTVLT